MRPINEKIQKKNKPKETEKRGMILELDYLTRRAGVRVKGGGFLEHVLIPKSIAIGTAERPKAWAGNFVMLGKDKRGRWVVTQYIARNDCAYPPPVADADVDDYTVPELDSFTNTEFAISVTPSDTFTPPTFRSIGVFNEPA